MQRRKAVFTTTGNETLTRYYLGDYEEDHNADGSVTKVHYISGGDPSGAGQGCLAAIYKETAGTGALYYAFTDYQGSLIALTNEDGTIANNNGTQQRFAYDPWGNRRDPLDWTKRITTAQNYLTDRGYTLHEHLDDFALINMNGRVYDPAIARFLSPDPMLQAPNHWLSYNRYAYCMNNPMLYTDPSGMSWFSDLWDGMWDGLNNFAEWADETDWFPSSGNFSTNIDMHRYQDVSNPENNYNTGVSLEQETWQNRQAAINNIIETPSLPSSSVEVPGLRRSSYVGNYSSMGSLGLSNGELSIGLKNVQNSEGFDLKNELSPSIGDSWSAGMPSHVYKDGTILVVSKNKNQYIDINSRRLRNEFLRSFHRDPRNRFKDPVCDNSFVVKVLYAIGSSSTPISNSAPYFLLPNPKSVYDDGVNAADRYRIRLTFTRLNMYTEYDVIY